MDDALGSALRIVHHGDANLALGISHFGYVLETGKIILQDDSAALRQNPQVKSAYLGL